MDGRLDSYREVEGIMIYFAEFDANGNKTAGYVADGMPHNAEDIKTNFQNAVEITEAEFNLYCAGYIRGVDGKPKEKPTYVPTLSELQDAAWSRIKSERDRREQAGAPYLGKVLDSDEKSVTRISIAVQAAQAAISAGTPFSLYWTMQDNSVVTMTAAEVVGMSVALAAHSNALHLAARAVREKIFAATDATGVEAAEAAVVWPE